MHLVFRKGGELVTNRISTRTLLHGARYKVKEVNIVVIIMVCIFYVKVEITTGAILGFTGVHVGLYGENLHYYML
jgi:hypothetical protein